LAPFLFLIVAEGLRSLVWETGGKNLFESVKVGEKGVNIDLL